MKHVKTFCDICHEEIKPNYESCIIYNSCIRLYSDICTPCEEQLWHYVKKLKKEKRNKVMKSLNEVNRDILK